MNQRTYRLLLGTIALCGGLAAWIYSTQLFPYHSLNHDEGVYLQQARLLLDGQLLLDPPLEGVFRPWFFLEAGGKLAPKYAPVPAAMFALGKLFGGFRLALVAIAVANLALVGGVVTEVFDRRTGVVSALFVLCSPLFLVQSGVFLPYAPTTLLNLAFAYAYFRADRSTESRAGRRWASFSGGMIGLAFFSRPFTAVLFATPFMLHAIWTLSREFEATRVRYALTVATGMFGVALTLGYNWFVTGSPLVFPYEAFAPLDGLGFGHRVLLDHELDYTPQVALRVNRLVVEQFFTDWIAGGVFGALLVLVGLATVRIRDITDRSAVLGALFLSISLGNVYFWGNYNILGVVGRAGDGLIAALGPCYHFDLLVPTAAFGAVGALALFDGLQRLAESVLARDTRFDRRHTRVGVAVLVVLASSGLGVVTMEEFEEPIETNMAVTDTYETAYEPFDGGPPKNSVILVPDTYGDWLNHPFQLLRNDPGYDGRAVYAIDDRPFAVAAEFPDRTVYRYAYRGVWNPQAGSPEAARLQRVESVSGESVSLETTLGVPAGALGATVTLETDDGRVYAASQNLSETLTTGLELSSEAVQLSGSANESRSLALDGRETVVLSVFLDTRGGGGVTYRLELPVDASSDGVRALTPRTAVCRDVRTCEGSAVFVESAVSEGIAVETTLESVS